MIFTLKNCLLCSLFVIFLVHTSYVVSANAATPWDEETLISVSIIGDTIVNLDSDNKLLRAYVDIINHDPSDGYYYLRIIQPGTDEIISEEEIIIRKKSNDKAGSDVAHMFNEEELSINGNIVLGNYILEVFSEKGSAKGIAPFSIIKPSVSNQSNDLKSLTDVDDSGGSVSIEKIDETIKVDINAEPTSKTLESKSQLENIGEIPDWVKNIFILYADDNISENELISALKFLIEQEIIKVD